MRTGAGFATPPLSPAGAQLPHSSWHSPVPYLFGGLAAMLGLIFLALLILACSYWKLSGYLDGSEGESEDRANNGKTGENGTKPAIGFVEQFVVIMAGEMKPTFLATPIASRAASFSGNAVVDDDKEKSRTLVGDGTKAGGEESGPSTEGDPAQLGESNENPLPHRDQQQ